VKAFHFRLATVARIRALEERVAADRFRTAQRVLRHEQASASAAGAALDTLEAPRGVTSMAALHWVGDQAERLAETVRVCRENVVAAEAACTEARDAWDVAVRRSGVLERLEEQERARWRSEALRAEAAELDDLSLTRHRLVGVGP
jgi:flagellar export protein FliJ